MTDAIEALESWVHGAKGRYVSEINVGTAYGATCWEVELCNTDVKPGADWAKEDTSGEYTFAKVYAAEARFIESDNPTPPNVVYVKDENTSGWPGLSKTILAAIERAEELGL